jgi:hypothetical protein
MFEGEDEDERRRRRGGPGGMPLEENLVMALRAGGVLTCGTRSTGRHKNKGRRCRSRAAGPRACQHPSHLPLDLVADRIPIRVTAAFAGKMSIE